MRERTPFLLLLRLVEGDTVRLAFVMTSMSWVPLTKPHGSDEESVHWGTVMLTKGVGTVMVETKVVVWVEVRVEVRGEKTVPKAIPTISATTNRDAITLFFMPHRVAKWAV